MGCWLKISSGSSIRSFDRNAGNMPLKVSRHERLSSFSSGDIAPALAISRGMARRRAARLHGEQETAVFCAQGNRVGGACR
jgi:hypothetical protein